MAIQLEKSWLDILGNEFEKPYFQNLKAFLLSEKESGQILFPKGNDIFNAFNNTSFYNTKVVLLGQDPYHGSGQAHGLSFSVPNGITPPPSLVNIFKELVSDIPGFVMPKNGNLTHWAQQGVLLLNATLTVRANQAGSHQGKGWETFTDTVIQKLSIERENLVFLLWGRFAQAKSILIDESKHLLLKAAHPSPFSANNGFFGCKHFSKTNDFLKRKGLSEINWQI
jgi:uracil-DNA glycosylase